MSAQGDRVLRALAAGQAARRAADGWQVGRVRAPAALIAELARAGLVQQRDDGLHLAEAGRVRLARDIAEEAPPRLLVERTLPDPGATRAMRRSVTVHLAESPLGWLAARGLVDRRQFDAGERLRGDWTMAGLGPRVTMRWDAMPRAARGSGDDAPLDPALAGIAARRRFDGAVAAAGKGLADILWRVVCAGEGLATAEGALGWPKRSGKLVLTMALDRVADYYRIA